MTCRTRSALRDVWRPGIAGLGATFLLFFAGSVLAGENSTGDEHGAITFVGHPNPSSDDTEGADLQSEMFDPFSSEVSKNSPHRSTFDVDSQNSPDDEHSEFASGSETSASHSLDNSFAAASAERASGARTKPNRRGLLRQSWFGDIDEGWRPLACSDFFRTGWNEAWGKPPKGSGGALRQGWVNAIDGLFYRTNFVFFSVPNDYHQNGNAYFGDYSIFLPVSRRFQFRITAPFLSARRAPQGGDYQVSFGDLAVTPRFLLSENEDLTQVVSVVARTPTGPTTTGNGETIVTPQYEFWYGGIPNGWAIRGTTGLATPMNDQGGRTQIQYNFAIGKYWRELDSGELGSFVTDVALKCYTTLDDRGPDYTYVSVTPGARAKIGHELYLLGGIEVPLTGPKTSSYSWAPIVVIVRNF